MKSALKPVALLSFLFAALTSLNAECVCKCVNGEVVPICRNAIDLEPICAPRVCPIVPPAIQPIPRPIVPPIGTKTCQPEQVYNEYTRRYEWKTVCE